MLPISEMSATCVPPQGQPGLSARLTIRGQLSCNPPMPISSLMTLPSRSNPYRELFVLCTLRNLTFETHKKYISDSEAVKKQTPWGYSLVELHHTRLQLPDMVLPQHGPAQSYQVQQSTSFKNQISP